MPICSYFGVHVGSLPLSFIIGGVRQVWFHYYSCPTCFYGEISGYSKTIPLLLLSFQNPLLFYVAFFNITFLNVYFSSLPCFHSCSTILHEENRILAFIERLWWFYSPQHTHTAFKSIPRCMFLLYHLWLWLNYGLSKFIC